MRYEIKYLVHNSKLDKLRKMVSPFLDIDKHAKGREGNQYTVRSIYFDSHKFTFYNEKIDGVPYRKKVRLRGYNEGGENATVFWEIKKKYQDPIKKDRWMLKYNQMLGMFEQFMNGNAYETLANMNGDFKHAQKFLYHIHTMQLFPLVTVIYDREPFVEKFPTVNDLRVTFDKNLRSIPFPTLDNLYSDENVRMTLKDHFILEVKYNHKYPPWMRPIIASFGFRRQAASKYVYCVDTHNLTEDYNRYKVFNEYRWFKHKPVKSRSLIYV